MGWINPSRKPLDPSTSLAAPWASWLAPATDTPTKALMRRPSIGCTGLLVNNAMWRDLTAFQISVLLALQYRGLDIFGINEKANGTMIFNVFVHTLVTGSDPIRIEIARVWVLGFAQQ